MPDRQGRGRAVEVMAAIVASRRYRRAGSRGTHSLADETSRGRHASWTSISHGPPGCPAGLAARRHRHDVERRASPSSLQHAPHRPGSTSLRGECQTRSRRCWVSLVRPGSTSKTERPAGRWSAPDCRADWCTAWRRAGAGRVVDESTLVRPNARAARRATTGPGSSVARTGHRRGRPTGYRHPGTASGHCASS